MQHNNIKFLLSENVTGIKIFTELGKIISIVPSVPHQGSPGVPSYPKGGRTIADYKICSTLHVTETGTLVPNTSETSYGSSAAPRNLQSKFDFRKNTDQNDNSQLSVKQP